MSGRGRRRRRGAQSPPWAPRMIDCDMASVVPYPGWVIVSESGRKVTDSKESGVLVTQLGIPHGTVGRVEAICPEDADRLRVRRGDQVVYREWAGGRWYFSGGEQALIMTVGDLLARVRHGLAR